MQRPHFTLRQVLATRVAHSIPSAPTFSAHIDVVEEIRLLRIQNPKKQLLGDKLQNAIANGHIVRSVLCTSTLDCKQSMLHRKTCLHRVLLCSGLELAWHTSLRVCYEVVDFRDVVRILCILSTPCVVPLRHALQYVVFKDGRAIKTHSILPFINPSICSSIHPSIRPSIHSFS